MTTLIIIFGCLMLYRADNYGAIYSTNIMLSVVGNKTLLTMNFSDDTESTFLKIMSVIMGLFIKRTMVQVLEKDLIEKGICGKVETTNC